MQYFRNLIENILIFMNTVLLQVTYRILDDISNIFRYKYSCVSYTKFFLRTLETIHIGSKVSKDLTKRSMWSKSTFSWYKTSEVNKLHHSASKTIFSSLATMSEMKVKLFNVKSLLSKWFWVARNRILKAPRTCNFSTLSGLPLVKADNANTNRLSVLKL